MHRRGHVGVAMIAYAPIGFILLRERQLGLALLGLFGVLLVEPLPDNDLWIPGLRHRGTSHSLLTALLVGVVIGALGWVAGDRVTVMLANVFAGLDTATVGIFAGIFQWAADQLRALDPRALAVFGFAVGVYGIFVHLLADVITISGIRPLLPLSRRRLSLSSLRADSPTANNGLFGLGVLALAVTLLLTAPGVGIAAGPLDLSPVGVAGAQSQNNSTNATVTFSNQTTNGSAVTIESVTLPASGFIALDDTGPGEEGSIEEDTIAVSDQLSAGTHRNVSIPMNQSPPGGVSNLTTLNATGTYQATLYEDTNDDGRFEYISSARSEDDPFIIGSGSSARFASDSAGIAIEGLPNGTQPAVVEFADQRTDGSTITVANATLPQGGFVVVHNASYLVPGSDPLRSAVGLSAYLPAGTHQNVTVELLNGTVSQSQRLVAVPSRDTNANQRYDYVRSDGFQDVPYQSANESVGAVANITVSGSEQRTTPSTTSGQSTNTSMPTSNTPTSTATTAPNATTEQENRGDQNLLYSIVGILVVILALVAIVGYFINRYRS